MSFMGKDKKKLLKGMISFRIWFVVILLFITMNLTAQTDKMIIIEGFQLEVFGGISTLNPMDFNLFVEYDDALQQLLYDQYYQYLLDTKQISSWDQESTGERRAIKYGIPFGFRIRYHLNPHIIFFIGFHFLHAGQSLNLHHIYNQHYASTEAIYGHSLEYSPYSMSINGFSPSLGISLNKKISDKIELEGSFSAGPLFAKCRYFRNWEFTWFYQMNSEPYPLWERAGSLEERGNGIGIALDIIGRVNYSLNKNWQIFLLAGYAYHRVSGFSGVGIENIDGRQKDWKDKWVIVSETVTTDWGKITKELPTNFSEPFKDDQIIRDFKLNLSRFQICFGVSLKFKITIEPRGY